MLWNGNYYTLPETLYKLSFEDDQVILAKDHEDTETNGRIH